MENINKYNKPISWAAFFSQTGSEICNISEKIGKYPDLIISDNTDMNSKLDERIELNCKQIVWRKFRGLSKEDKLKYFRDRLQGYDVITLHGWLNIIPEEVCKEFKIFNGHPGLINYYPDLKGKDPVERVWHRISDYLYVGSVVHEVTKEIDGGKIICYSKESYVNCTTLEEVYLTAKRTSLASWIDFFTNKRYNIAC
jgi:folate-dependent phosphoribosylglycinamide formyltransferase PurN